MRTAFSIIWTYFFIVFFNFDGISTSKARISLSLWSGPRSPRNLFEAKPNNLSQCKSSTINVSEWYNSVNIPTGIKNLGNTCYLNSIIQLLYHSEPVRNYILQSNFIKNSRSNSLKNIFRFLDNRRTTDEFVSVNPSDFAKSLDLDVSTQEDAQEFLLKLLEIIDADVKFSNLEKEPISELFRGSTNLTITCRNVNYVKVKSQFFLDLSVNVNDADNLAEAISNLLEPEIMEGENQYNAGPHGYQDAVKQLYITSLPQLLIIHINRFEFDSYLQNFRKNNQPMPFPFELDMSSFVEREKGRVLYDLSSVVVHEGSLNFGHYTCYSRHIISSNSTAGQWYEFNDEITSYADEENVKMAAYGHKINNTYSASKFSLKNAYVLLYQKRQR